MTFAPPACTDTHGKAGMAHWQLHEATDPKQTPDTSDDCPSWNTQALPKPRPVKQGNSYLAAGELQEAVTSHPRSCKAASNTPTASCSAARKSRLATAAEMSKNTWQGGGKLPSAEHGKSTSSPG